jgi:hypothetical protein
VASATCIALRLHVSAAPPQGGLTQALAMHENSRPALHQPFFIVGGFGVGMILLGVFLHQEILMKAGSFIAGATMLSGNIFALSRGAIFSLKPAKTVYAKENPILFTLWLPLSLVSSSVLTLAGFDVEGLISSLHG